MCNYRGWGMEQDELGTQPMEGMYSKWEMD
jgi:hypothetical protein